MFCYINGNGSRLLLFVQQRFFARQTKGTVLDQGVFDPLDGFVNVTDDRIVFVRKVFHRLIGSPVLEGEEETVFDFQFRGRPAAELMEFFEGGLEDFQHFEKGVSFDTEELFEFSVAERQGFLHSLGWDDHCRQQVGGKMLLTEDRHFRKITQYQFSTPTTKGG